MYIDKMAGLAYIDATRKYLDYLEEHLKYVAEAFEEVSDACAGKEWWVGDDYEWHLTRQEVEQHDLSKFSKEEFIQYREAFFPIKGMQAKQLDANAWDHHKEMNHHHHETAKTYRDIVHMVIDWVAMSYKFGDNPRDFYNSIKQTMQLEEKYHEYIDTLFCHLEAFRKLKVDSRNGNE